MKKLLFILLLFPFSALAFNYDSTLVAWYRMDTNDITGTTLLDKSIYGNNATLVNSPLIRQAGQISQSIKFNGTSQYVNAGSASVVDDLVYNHSMSVCFSERRLNGTTARVIMGKNDNNGSAGWFIQENATAGQLRMELVKSSTNYYWAVAIPPANKWTRICVVFDYTNLNSPSLQKIYFNDGKEQPILSSSFGSGSAGSDAAQTMYLGNAYPASRGSFFSGYMDDVAIYNVAITASKVKKDYYRTVLKSYLF